MPTRQSKEDMRREISQLRAHRQQAERILSVLTSHEHPEQILSQLQNGDPSRNLAARLRSASLTSTPSANVTTYARAGDRQAISHALEPAQSIGKTPSKLQSFPETTHMPWKGKQTDPTEPDRTWMNGENIPNEPLSGTHELDAMNWTMESTSHDNFSPHYPAVGVWHEQPMNPVYDNFQQPVMQQGEELILGTSAEGENLSEHHGSNQEDEPWTTVTSDIEVVKHLLALYFCWEYPIFASLSKEHFLEDFRQGNPRYCSPLLVNSLLALACRWSDRSSARSDLEQSVPTGDDFFAEALKLFEAEEDHRELTTIQALGIMSIREASCGRVSEGIYFSGQSMRLAIEMGLHLEAEDGSQSKVADADEAVRGATFWGAFSLDE